VDECKPLGGGSFLETIGFVNDGETLTLPLDKVGVVHTTM
jgi:hypothetical protein